jgi:hypothetical protein
MTGDTVYLDSLSPLLAQVGYGELGIRGRLEYEHKLVSVQRQHVRHALSTHPPAVPSQWAVYQLSLSGNAQ